MQKITALCCFLLFSFTSMAQNAPVNINLSKQLATTGETELVFRAIIKKGVKLAALKKDSSNLFASIINYTDSAIQKYFSGAPVVSGTPKTANEEGVGAYTYFEDSVTWVQKLNITAPDSAIFKGQVEYMYADTDGSFLTAEAPAVFRIFVKGQNASGNTATVKPGEMPEQKKKSLWRIILLSFLAGLAAVLTPCVFPLVPMTVSFFTKRSINRKTGIRNALSYSFSIVFIYTIPTLLLTLLFGGDILYRISTSLGANILFFLIFLIFAISFFGAFDISLPNSWANKIDARAGKGGFIGVFFMALTLVIVSFSCTGPIVSSLLVQTSSQKLSLAPVLGMMFFGIGLAIPFSLFAFFPSWLNGLPKSGGWLNSVKVTFGFVELALALKFFSNIDLAFHWRILDREIFLAIWITLSLLLGFYLLGKLKFAHDSDLKHISVPRLFFAIAAFTFAVYLTPGLWGAPLKAMSGLLPGTGTQDFNLHEQKYQLQNIEERIKKGGSGTAAANAAEEIEPKLYQDILHVPYGLTAFFDLDEGIMAAKKLKKPIMLDFTGHSCANCRKMENEVWENPEVLRRMKEDFVLISLYVDDRTDLPEAEIDKFKSQGKDITTLGDKNLAYEREKFNEIAQPLYMFLDNDGNPLSNVKYGYDSDIQKFINHLETVKKGFQKRTTAK
jgi:thiol:disulfide interchange protein